MNEQYGGFSFNPRNWEYFKNKRLKKETKKDTLKQSRDRFKTLDEIDFFSWAEYFAREVAEQIRQIPEDLRPTIASLTSELNARRIPTAKGGSWHRQSVYRLLERCESLGLELSS